MAMHKEYSYTNKKGTKVTVKAHNEAHPVVFGKRVSGAKKKAKKRKKK